MYKRQVCILMTDVFIGEETQITTPANEYKQWCSNTDYKQPLTHTNKDCSVMCTLACQAVSLVVLCKHFGRAFDGHLQCRKLQNTDKGFIVSDH